MCASGFVYPDGGEPGPRGLAKLVVGSAERGVVAFGPRVWQEGALGLTPTTPLPFEVVEMSWQNAYGGRILEPTTTLKVDGEEAIFPEHEAAYPLNTDGTGFYTTRSQALEHALPSLEHPDHLIQSWDDRPEPVCLAPYPLWGGMRAANVLDEADKRVDLGRLGRVTTRSAPRTTFDDIPYGTRVAVEGMRPRGETLAFEVPPHPGVFEVLVGDRSERVEPRLDSIDIDTQAAEVRFVYRATYRYPLIAHETRSARCEPSDAFPRAPNRDEPENAPED